MSYLFALTASVRAVFRLLHIVFILLSEATVYLVLRSKYNLGRRLRQRLEQLGPTFVKFGQILSTRRDILSGEIRGELEKLQSNVAPFSYKEARQVLEKSFKKSPEKIFSEFKKEPVASASLGQVYAAKLKSGEKVAVKIQRPRAKRIITVDVEVLLGLVWFLERLSPSLRAYNLREAVQEFRRWTLNELNYTLEAANAEIFNQHFQDDPHIYSPKVFWDYTTKQVLILEYIEGAPLLEIINAPGNAERKKRIARFGADAFLRQYFEFGFFHADPHPGNLFVLPKDVLYFLDFGIVGRLDSRLTELVANLFLALLQKDEEQVVQTMVLIHNQYRDEKAINLSQSRINSFRRRASEIIDQWFGVANREHSFTLIFYDLLHAAAGNGFFVPVDVLLLAKSIVTLDNVTRQLDESFSLQSLEEPLLKKLLLKRLDPERLERQSRQALQVLERMITSLPLYSEQLTNQLAANKTNAAWGPEQLAEYEMRLETRVSRRSLATVIAALVIGSSFLYPSQESTVGFILSFVLLLRLLTIKTLGRT